MLKIDLRRRQEEPNGSFLIRTTDIVKLNTGIKDYLIGLIKARQYRQYRFMIP